MAEARRIVAKGLPFDSAWSQACCLYAPALGSDRRMGSVLSPRLSRRWL